MPSEKFQGDFINSKVIIDWMNEWSAGTDRVPKFEEVKRFEDGVIRVDFGGDKLLMYCM